MSPQFNDSPVIALLEIFQLFDFKLKYNCFNFSLDSFDILEEKSRKMLFETFLNAEGKKRGKVEEKLSKLGDKQAKIFFGA